jgi:hypothetical protein
LFCGDRELAELRERRSKKKLKTDAETRADLQTRDFLIFKMVSVHRSCRGGVRCGGVGERAIAGERERMGGRKEEKEKKKRGEGRVGGGANELFNF